MKIKIGVSLWADIFFAIEQVADKFLKRIPGRIRRRPDWVHSGASS